MRKILAVCKGNRARSPMFEHLLRRALAQIDTIDTVVVESAAGLQETDSKEAEEGAVIALNGVGIDITNHRARWMGKLDLTQYDKIYCMDPAVMPLVQEQLRVSSNSVLMLVNAPEGIPNPYGKDQTAYQLALEVVQREVERLVTEEF